MRPSMRILTFVAFAGAVCTAGGMHKVSTRPPGVLTIDRLVAELRHQSVTVSSLGLEPRDAFPFFSVPATRLTVNGDDVHIFEFTTETIATNAASTVAAAGTLVGTPQVVWYSPPHFYQRNRFIVLYRDGAGETARAGRGVWKALSLSTVVRASLRFQDHCQAPPAPMTTVQSAAPGTDPGTATSPRST